MWQKRGPALLCLLLATALTVFAAARSPAEVVVAELPGLPFHHGAAIRTYIGILHRRSAR